MMETQEENKWSTASPVAETDSESHCHFHQLHQEIPLGLRLQQEATTIISTFLFMLEII